MRQRKSLSIAIQLAIVLRKCVLWISVGLLPLVAVMVALNGKSAGWGNVGLQAVLTVAALLVINAFFTGLAWIISNRLRSP